VLRALPGRCCLAARRDSHARGRRFASDADFKRKSLHELNCEALQFHKAGDDLRCVAAFAKLFRKIRENNVVHRELYVVHSNRAAAYLNLGLYEEALWDARRCAELAEAQFARSQERSALPSYVKSFARRGFALMGLRLHRLAKAAFEEGLRHDPFAEELKRGLEESTQALLGDLLSGQGHQTLALPAPTRRDRIAYLPYATPLHVVHPRSLLPVALLTPFQAENDHHVKDTYNYMTVQADIRIPKRQFAVFDDNARIDAFDAAIRHAISALQAEDKDARVLHLGSSGGLLPLLSLKHGARHVTAAERWLYMALSCKEALDGNGVDSAKAAVIYKRPTDLALRTDVPVACNLLVCDMLEDGLLSAGLIPACRYALSRLMLPDALVIPAAATVYAQAVELRVDTVCGFDVSAINLFRWEPGHAGGTPLSPGAYVPLSQPVRVWHFDMLTPPEESDTRLADLTFERAGRFNAVLFWFDLHLGGGITLSTGPGSAVKTLRPAVQYIPGELGVKGGTVLPLRCSHNTVQMRFDLEREEYTHLYKQDASFPRFHFALLRDEHRARAYQAAISRQVSKRKALGKDVHALDLGTGSGLLAMMTAKAGADSVVAAEIHEPLAQVARRNVAANGMSRTVSVAMRDIGLLERGRDVRHQGCNFVVMDLFDAGLLGDRVVQLLATARMNVLQTGATVVPAAATLYCMGVEAHTSDVRGFDFGKFNKYRWENTYEAVRMEEVPHRRLTRPKRVFETFFDGSAKNSAQEGILKLEVVADGLLNAVCFWFDLHLDEEATITSAPVGLGNGGVPELAAVQVRARTPPPLAGCARSHHSSSGAGWQPLRGCAPRRQRRSAAWALLGPGVAVPGACDAGAGGQEAHAAVQGGG